MKLKSNFIIEAAAEKLKKELFTYIAVTVRSNIIDSNKKWLDVDKDTFVGVRVTFYAEHPLLITYVPNFAARVFFGGIVSGVFHHSARNDFKKQIETFLILEFYEQ
jgi:hypothetical protein